MSVPTKIQQRIPRGLRVKFHCISDFVSELGLSSLTSQKPCPSNNDNAEAIFITSITAVFSNMIIPCRISTEMETNKSSFLSDVVCICVLGCCSGSSTSLVCSRLCDSWPSHGGSNGDRQADPPSRRERTPGSACTTESTEQWTHQTKTPWIKETDHPLNQNHTAAGTAWVGEIRSGAPMAGFGAR